MNPASDPSLPAELCTRAFLAESLAVFRHGWWLFVKIIAPALAFATVAGFLSARVAASFMRRMSGFEYGSDYAVKVAGVLSAVLVGAFIAWLAYGFAFAAICIAVRELRQGATPTAEECYAPARERVAPVLRLATLLFSLWVAAAALSVAIAFVVSISRAGPVVGEVVRYGFLAFFAVLLARFGLAMPAVLFDGCTVMRSMFRSDEYTEGRWTILVALLLKSVGGSLLTVLIAVLITDLLAGNSATSQEVLEWTFYGLIFLGMLLVQPHMFIGFALLYLKASESRVQAGAALAAGRV